MHLCLLSWCGTFFLFSGWVSYKNIMKKIIKSVTIQSVVCFCSLLSFLFTVTSAAFDTDRYLAISVMIKTLFYKQIQN